MTPNHLPLVLQGLSANERTAAHVARNFSRRPAREARSAQYLPWWGDLARGGIPHADCQITFSRRINS